jgi:hypothetical protein
MQPAFYKSRVESYAQTMVQLTQEELATWQLYQEINITQSLQKKKSPNCTLLKFFWQCLQADTIFLQYIVNNKHLYSFKTKLHGFQ